MVNERTAAVVLTAREYDVYSVANLERELGGLDAPHCTVDLRYVQYLDTTCISALIRVLKRLRRSDPQSTLTIRNVRASLLRVFQIANLDRIFDIRDAA